MKIEEKFCETKFGKICYLEIGKGNKTSVYLHGWFGHPAPAFSVYSVLESKGFRVVAPYLPGHGKSFGVSSNLTFKNLTEILSEFYERLGLVNTYTIGHSVGASLAWEITLKNDGKVQKALVVDAFSNLHGKGKISLLKSWLDDEAKWNLIKEFIKKRPDYKNNDFRIEYFQRSAFESANILKSLIVSKKLEKTPPFLFLWGERDEVCPMKDFIDSSGIEEKEIIKFAGGHWWFINHPDELKRNIAEFAGTS